MLDDVHFPELASVSGVASLVTRRKGGRYGRHPSTRSMPSSPLIMKKKHPVKTLALH